MRKPALYSTSSRTSPDARDGVQSSPPPVAAWSRWRSRIHGARVPIVCMALALLAVAIALFALSRPSPHALTQKDIDAAVLHTLDTHALPSMAQKAYAAIRPSVVHVRGVRHEAAEPRKSRSKPSAKGRRAAGGQGEHSRPEAGNPDDLLSIGIGTGVVIVATGIILTNMHVIDGADSIVVTFADGSESPADVISTQPENDLAVLKARVVPDDLPAATLRSTSDLGVGDDVVAVGFPFGIGPSASAGIVSGLRREYRSEHGQVLTNLIQFDAAANPGNSGGPLVTADGEVVGIVTGIFNPSDQRVFIGIGFAVPIENAAAAVGLSPF